MKTSFCFLVFFTISCVTLSQERFVCTYTDSLNISDFEKQIGQIKSKLIDKGLPEDVAKQYIDRNFPDKNSFLRIEQRVVNVYKDSSVIKLNYNSGNDNLVFQLPTNMMMVKNGILSKYNSADQVFIESKVSDSSRFFTESSYNMEILGYKCVAYISLDHSFLIWVCKNLPSEINPGISVANVKGGILRFEVRIGNAHTISSISKIESPKQVI